MKSGIFFKVELNNCCFGRMVMKKTKLKGELSSETCF